ncbi:winged helix-turn-helix transcriptional regulator [Promicromonospora sp. NPDC060271]|uniref:winged helix-turn-helix transcriptional regulator n=1 Tax=Promicromonospora sp. NPDC060271 TaxID=3347089 RepID=UPI003664C921
MRYADLSDTDCGIAQTMGVVGDWWAWLVLREIAGGLTRFDRIQGSLGISRRALTERLGTLVDHQILVRRAYSEHPPRHDYVLTEKGEGLLSVLVAMQEFGDRYLLGDGSVSASPAGDSAETRRVHELTGRPMPELSLATHDGTTVAVGGETPGRWRVLFLFPGAFAPGDAPPAWGQVPGTAGCTLEATTYAARHADFAALGADVIGISTQRTDELAAFADFSRLPYRLASDGDALLAAHLRLPLFRTAGQERYKRQTLLVSPSGSVAHVQMPITDPAGSVTDMLETIRHLGG